MKTTSCPFACLVSIHFAGILSVAAIVYPFQVSLAQERDQQSERESLAKLAKMAEDLSPQVRVHAALAYRGIGVAEMSSSSQLSAASQLIKLLQDKDGGVRDAAATALGDVGPDHGSFAVRELTKLLDDKLWYVRDSAAEALGKLGPLPGATEKVVPKLTDMLRDPNWRLRSTAATALGKLGRYASASADDLAKLLHDSDRDVRNAAEEALTQLGRHAKTAVPYLVTLLKYDDAWVSRAVVLKNDGTSVHKETIPMSDDKSVCRAALRVLGKIGPFAKEAVPAVIETANGNNAGLCLPAVIALGEIGLAAKEALPTLAKLATNTECLCRLQAIEAIEKIGPSDLAAVNAIVQLMDDRSRTIRQEAEHAWDLLGANDIPSIKIVACSKELSDRTKAVNKLLDIGQPAVPSLIELVKCDDADVRRMAVDTLGQIGSSAKELYSLSLVPFAIRIDTFAPQRR